MNKISDDDIELIITSLTELTKKRRLIYINYEPAFALYNSEVKKLELNEGGIISHELYSDILNNILKKRCTIRAMELLKSRDYTVKELTDKLRDGYYPAEIIDDAISYVSRYGYLDDSRYADNYIRFKANNKSRRQIEQQLSMKGIADDIIRAKLDEFYDENEDTEYEQVLLLLRKKLDSSKSFNYNDYKQRQKLMASIYRKGYSIDIINKAFDELANHSHHL